MVRAALLVLPTAGAFMLAPTTRLASATARAGLCMTEEEPPEDYYSTYVKDRKSGAYNPDTAPSFEEAEKGYIEFEKYDTDFDGGDSGGGVVGDGNTDLEDQHNSASVVRGGFGQADGGGSSASSQVGRGRVQSATTARVASAGKNYFGRESSGGYADQKIDSMTDEDIKNHKIDYVRAQQLENWFNQRAIHKQNRDSGQGVVFGEPKSDGGLYNAQRALSSKAWRTGANELEISQRDLARHLDEMRDVAAPRLDGEEWGELTLDGGELAETFEVKCTVGSTFVQEIPVKNKFNTFAPYRVGFAPGSHRDFTVTPAAGTMNRRDSDPVNVLVRYNPKEYGEAKLAALIFETEDFKTVWNFIGST